MSKEWIVPDEDLGCDGAYFSYTEVVRCRECKWCEKSSIIDVCICTHEAGLIDPKLDDYCSYGERRTDDR